MKFVLLFLVLGFFPFVSWGSEVENFQRNVDEQLASCLENLQFSAEFGECLSVAETRYMDFVEQKHASSQDMLFKFNEIIESCNILEEGENADYAGRSICRLENARNFAIYENVTYLDRVNRYIGLGSRQLDQESDVSSYNGVLYWHGGNLFNCYSWYAGSLDSAVKYVSDRSGSRVVDVTETENGALISLEERNIQAWYKQVDCQEDRLKLPGAIHH